MRYLRKRGRPPVCRPDIDLGTKELQEKRKRFKTDEPLDICLKRGFISPEQHTSGMHLRWLHTIRHGVVGVKSIDVSNIGGVDRKIENEKWTKAREEEYQEAMGKLRSIGLDKQVINICIYNEYPQFLRYTQRKFFNIEDDRKLKKIRRGLNMLAKDFSVLY
jgi:hypothetical protein